MFGRNKKSKKRKLLPGSREILLKGRDAKRFRDIVAGKMKLGQAMNNLKAEIAGFDKAGAVVAQSYLRGGEMWMTFNGETNVLVVGKPPQKPEAPVPPAVPKIPKEPKKKRK